VAIAALMRDMDAFAFASRFEAYGMALAEAAAAGLPAVSANVGAASRIYDHGSTGLLVPPNDHSALRAELARVLTDPALRERFRRNLRLHKPRAWQDTLVDFERALPPLPCHER
jgi:glycosyltransferase involved in cell wall biosynthesis